MKRLLVAWAILTGKMRLANDNCIRCDKRHISSDEEVIKKVRARALEQAADDLKLARGVIAGMGKSKEYVEMRNQTVEGAK